MKRTIPTLIIAIMGCLMPALAQQTRFQQTAAFHKRPLFYFGTAKVNFLNPRFVANVDNKVLSWQPSYTVGLQYTVYPLTFHAGYFHTAYKVENYTWDYEEGTKIKHRGLEVGAACMLLPQVKYIQPFVGAAYHHAAIGVGLDQDENDNDNVEVSSVKASTALFRTGLCIRFMKGLALSGEYQRSLKLKDNAEAFSRFALALLVNPYAGEK